MKKLQKKSCHRRIIILQENSSLGSITRANNIRVNFVNKLDNEKCKF